MIVSHVGPPTGRIGGPAGYLHQLRSAALGDPHPRHDVRFPQTSTGARPPQVSSTPSLSVLTRLRRKVIGPKFYRPPAEDLKQPGGVVDRMMRDLTRDVRADTAVSLASALADAAIVFTHDSFSAESALAQRRPGQQVWMMCHAVIPMGLYVAWSWGVPEADWRALLEFPDVRGWIDWELDVWKRVDGVVLPCPEAAESFDTIDRRLGDVLRQARFVLSGASAPAGFGSGADLLGPRNENQRVGLYLGSPEPYRGFDALIAGIQALPANSQVTVAVAGPDPRKLPAHPAIRALGRVEDVGALLASVDFLVNVNRFSLFDLSTIEAAQAGKPLMLHAVGGNRAFERLGAGCMMLGDIAPATIADGLMRAAVLDASALAVLGQESRTCWETHLTPRHMWDRHLKLYDELAAHDRQ